MSEAPRRPRRIARTTTSGTTITPRVRELRSPASLARESAYMVTELKRVVGVTALCFGMLAVLVVVHRLQ